MTKIVRSSLALSLLLGLGCAQNGSINFNDVVSIPKGDGAGTALSGDFQSIFKVTSDGCAQVAALKIPLVGGDPKPLPLTLAQDGGSITFTPQDDTILPVLRGAITFKNAFDVGGAEIIGVDGEGNILRLIHVTGSFTSQNQFAGSGSERFMGKIGTEDVDCTFSFDITDGVRNG